MCHCGCPDDKPEHGGSPLISLEIGKKKLKMNLKLLGEAGNLLQSGASLAVSVSEELALIKYILRVSKQRTLCPRYYNRLQVGF